MNALNAFPGVIPGRAKREPGIRVLKTIAATDRHRS
jgi:hypothetical protein